MVMQMSEDWINDRIKKSFSSLKVEILDNYTRHVFLVTPLQSMAHAEALMEIVENGALDNPAKAQPIAQKHATHAVQREFGEQDLIAAEKTYKENGRYRRTNNVNGGTKHERI
jgi:hypothetical protein